MEIADKGELISFAEASKLAEEVETILKKNGISISNGSALERGLLLLHQLKYWHEGSRDDASWKTLAADLREAVGVLHLIRLVVRYQSHHEFAKLVPHLRMLNKGEVAQTKTALVTDQASNKIFELNFALATLESATQIEMDDPEHSSGGANPDIIARMGDCRNWGFACKAVQTNSPKTLFDNLVDGMSQIERSFSDTGIVIITLKNLFPHELLLPELTKDEAGYPYLGVFRNSTDARELLHQLVGQQVQAMLDTVGEKEVIEAVRDKKALPGFIVPVIVGVGVLTQKGPTPTTVGFLDLAHLDPHFYDPLTRFDQPVKDIFTQLNHGFWTVP